MAWLRLTLDITADQVESATEFLEQFEAVSISYQPRSGESLYAGIGEEPMLWHRTSVSALIDTETDMDILLVCLRNRIGAENIFSHNIDLLEDRDWIKSYENSVSPLVFGDSLCISPSWIQPDPDFMYLVKLDPGLAFGSGSHPTTRLCLEWLVHNKIRDRIIIDYGCGSGILSLAAAILGARHVYAVDVDPQALAATRLNADNNRLGDRISILAPEQNSLPASDILIANILLKPLVALAAMFSSLVKPGGQVVLSGIMSTQVTECLAAYNRWFKMGETSYHDEWALVNGYR